MLFKNLQEKNLNKKDFKKLYRKIRIELNHNFPIPDKYGWVVNIALNNEDTSDFYFTVEHIREVNYLTDGDYKRGQYV
jgi:hypothetical protein